MSTNSIEWRTWDAAAKERDRLYREYSALRLRYEVATDRALEAQNAYYRAFPNSDAAVVGGGKTDAHE